LSLHFLLHFKRYSRLPRYIQQIIHHRFQQRDSFFASDRFGFALGIAGNQRAFGAGGRFRVAKYLNPVVDLFLELVFVDEAVDLQGAEEDGLAAEDCSELVRYYG
jgi:hypothetical protein